MKVYINGYLNRWDAFTLFDWYIDKKYGPEHKWAYDLQLTKGEDFFHRFSNWWQRVLNATINRLIDALHFKYIKVDKYDTHDAEVTLAYVILPVLIKFRKELFSCPFVDNEDVPEELRTEDSFSMDKWKYVLDEMIWAFDHIANFEKEDEETCDSTGKYDKQKAKAFYDRINNGLRLFGKYYSCLWQ